MPVTQHDILLLNTLARFYVLTREQLQRLCFPDHQSGRSTRKRLTKLRQDGYLQKHRIPVAFPGTNAAAPVYYLAKPAAEVLASWFGDESFLAVNTKTPRGDRLNHWIAVNETRMTLERAVAAEPRVKLEAWINEWETVNKDAAAAEQFCLHTQLHENPPLSCSPDAGFLLTLGPYRKVYYLEQDLGTSSPQQVAARKTKGYAELAAIEGHRRHFPSTTFNVFGVLCLTTNAYRRKAIAKCVAKRPRPELWLFIDQSEVTPESFLTGPITYNHAEQPAPLVELDSDSTDNQPPSQSGNPQ